MICQRHLNLIHEPPTWSAEVASREQRQVCMALGGLADGLMVVMGFVQVFA